LNVAGLCNENKRNWYGIDLADLIEGAAKLEMTDLEVRAIVRNAMWAQAAVSAFDAENHAEAAIPQMQPRSEES
jgi:hypothetical protein